MLKPTRTTLALATGSLVLGLVGAGAAVADEGPTENRPPREIIVGDGYGEHGEYPYDKHALGKVVSKGPLKVRSKPNTHSKTVGHVHPNQKVEIDCKKSGEKVNGNRLWYRLAEEHNSWENGTGRPDRVAYDKERWVSARYVENLSEVKYCR